MGVETGVDGIEDFNIAWPRDVDQVSEGAAHDRLTKVGILGSFPNVTEPVTATHTELNLLDGVTATTAELNILDGVTSTAAELNILDGVTSTAAELNILDGVTSTAAELNVLDGYTGSVTELEYLKTLYDTGVTDTEFDYLDGVTSNIQTQINAVAGNDNAGGQYSGTNSHGSSSPPITVVSRGLTVTGSKVVKVHYRFTCDNTQGTLYVRRNGATLASATYSSDMDDWLIDAPGAGSHTYDLYYNGPSPGSTGTAFLARLHVQETDNT